MRSLLPAVLLAASPCLAEAQSGRATILQAWRRHQAAIESARFQFTETQAHRRDWLPNPWHAEYEYQTDTSLIVERTDTVTRTLAVAGARMRYIFTGRRRSADGRRPVRDTSLIDWTALRAEAQDLWMRPILLAIRPLDPNLGLLHFGRAVVTAGRDTTWRRMESLLVFESPRDATGWKTSLWLDPGRDYAIRRYLLVKGDIAVVEQTIDYYRDARFGWLPCRWVTNRAKPAGMLWRSGEARVTAITVNGAQRPLPAPDARREDACR